jgi:hypothetical protein
MTEDAILESLEEAHARAIIEASGGYGALARYRFTHAYFRQTLYDEIFGPRRIRWHRLSAAVIEEVYAETLNEHAGELAAHYAHSSDSADLARALTFDELAAHEAMRVSALESAPAIWSGRFRWRACWRRGLRSSGAISSWSSAKR